MGSLPDVDIEPAPNLSYFTPAQHPPAGCTSDDGGSRAEPGCSQGQQTGGRQFTQPLHERGARHEPDR